MHGHDNEEDVVSMTMATGPYFQSGEDITPSGKVWESVDNMSDEFSTATIDTAKWQLEPVGNGWNWIGRPPGLFQPENVSIENGKMTVTVGVLDQPQTINGKEFKYKGAIVRSKNPGQVGWYYETKMKANKTEMSSTFWLMTKYDCHKKLELDIQECVGVVSPDADQWATGWDRIFHSNCIHRQTTCVDKLQLQNSVKPFTENHQRYFVYAAWWKSKDEIQFFLDGKYVYSIHPEVDWDMPAFLQMAIETYDWNPVPANGGAVASAPVSDRKTQYEWIRTWKLNDAP
ncbi:glycosyl hydrolase [Echinicola strongylocentroti]|uniref:Glycosyl hydrolase n=2 Tax=Echinicola strongylocentroti TaxID=1795355 RepID=A0A2Z4IPI4_9BACT|nr:glycosyl hydrolase [Echinicola strongylocentroti]